MDGARDATILELHVDEEPVFGATGRLTGRRRTFSRHKVRLGVGVAVCALGFTAGRALLDAPPSVRMGDIERSIRSDLSGGLLGDGRVDRVRCVRETDSGARCLADVYDRSGVGPVTQRVTVRIDPETGAYVWRVD